MTATKLLGVLKLALVLVLLLTFTMTVLIADFDAHPPGFAGEASRAPLQEPASKALAEAWE